MKTQELLVADLMTIDPIVVRVDASLDHAARAFHTNAVTGVPVVDAAGDLVGVISQSDLVALQDSRLGGVVRAHAGIVRVGEVMSSPAITVAMTATLADAARQMLDGHVHRLVALDDAGRLVGVLSATDFLRLYADR